MSPTLSSPEEEEEEIEELLPAGRIPLPSSVTKDLLRASVSRSSRGSRGGTSMTPTPKRTLIVEPRHSVPSRSTATVAKDTDSNTDTLVERPSSSRSIPGPSSSSKDVGVREIVRSDRGDHLAKMGDVGQDQSDKEDELSDISILESAPTAGPSRLVHGHRNGSSEPLFSNARTTSSRSSSTSTLHHFSPTPVGKYRGSPYVEIPYKPLIALRRYDKPLNARHPTTLSRNHQIQFNQTPPPSSVDSDSSIEEIKYIPPARPARTVNARTVPTWRTRTNSASSPDLGGYGSDPSSEEEEDSEASEDSISGPRRTTRSKGKQVERPRRSRNAHKQQSKYSRSFIVDDSSRSTSHEVHAMPISTRRNARVPNGNGNGISKNKRKFDAVSVSSEAYELSSDPSSGEDELATDSDYSDARRPRRKDRGKAEPARGYIKPEVLTYHRSFCEKCGRGPADDILQKALHRKRKPGRRRKKDPDEISDEELAGDLGGWLECERCVVTAHWGCLGDKQRKEVLARLREVEGPVGDGHRRIRRVEVDEQASFRCARCDLKSGCMVCHRDKLSKETKEADEDPVKAKAPVEDASKAAEDADGDVEMKEDRSDEDEKEMLRFRCVRCKQEAHYEHLDNPFEEESPRLARIADYYQKATAKGRDGWQCHQCRNWIWTVDMIIAWRPLPADAKEELDSDEIPNYRDPLPREYLVKWQNRGFRHATWVPHPWLVANSAPRLKNFLAKGPSLDLVTDETLAARGDDMAAPTIANIMQEADSAKTKGQHRSGDSKDSWKGAGPPPDIDAENSIPVAWKTVDRILDVMLLPPSGPSSSKSKNARSRVRSESVFDVDEDDQKALKDGIQPSSDLQMDIGDWEEETDRELGPEDVDKVAELVSWCYVKWDDLQYEQSTWDTPPPKESPLYPAFHRALGRYLAARQVNIPILSRSQCEVREIRAAKFSKPPDKQPDCIVGGTLMPFQINGFQWLLTKHFKRESCILADDMGLGKTIQIASLIGYLGSSAHNIYPFLVIVPNSTITNWVREFEKWVPHMRVVPYYGQKASRKIVSKYELYHKDMQGAAMGLKAHVVLTTYDTITSQDFNVFKAIPRWEMLVVDEGQRLKSDSNLIFNRLKTLKTVHRILLTGTPLNNNLRELFNLLHFLDPDSFKHLEDLEAKFQDLNEGLLAELHAMIQPYILRRIKGDVLRLPPKVEIIVPISLTPIQKQIYRSILEKNAEFIQAMLQQRKKRAKVSIAGGGPVEKKKTNGSPLKEPEAEPTRVE